MEFNFVEDDDEEFLDLADVENDEQEVDGIGFAFTEAVPERKTLADPEVKTKAQASRRAQPRAYGDRVAQGWSLYCAHQQHLPNLCEREQDRGKVECSCPCHPKRGYVYREPESLHRGDDEEEVLILT